MKLSAVITSFNSARTLERCLQSLGFADEIVVLDSGSTDGSLELAHRYASRVELQPFLGYAAQKQKAIDLAQHDWVLLLDSDEWLAPDAAKYLRVAMLGQHQGYRLPRIERVFWRYQHPSTRPNYFLRLFQKSRTRMSQHRVHESPVTEGSVIQLDVPIWHDGEIDLASKVDKLNRYSSLATQDWHAGKSRAPSAWRLTLYPLWYFFRAYILKRQFLNGWAGYCNSVELAHYAFLKYAKRLEALQAEAQPPAHSLPRQDPP
jgi:glycosyltransferase involved in cell wall biosynthesis